MINLIDRTNLMDFLDTLESDGKSVILYFLKDPSEEVKVKFINYIPKKFNYEKYLKDNKNIEAILVYDGNNDDIIDFYSKRLTLEDYLSFPELFFYKIRS